MSAGLVVTVVHDTARSPTLHHAGVGAADGGLAHRARDAAFGDLATLRWVILAVLTLRTTVVVLVISVAATLVRLRRRNSMTISVLARRWRNGGMAIVVSQTSVREVLASLRSTIRGRPYAVRSGEHTGRVTTRCVLER